MLVPRYKGNKRELVWTLLATTILLPDCVIKEMGKLSLGEALASLTEKGSGPGARVAGKAHLERGIVPRCMLGPC